MTAPYWHTECVEGVRVLINDFSDTPTYTDSRLQRLIVVAALQITQELTFDTNYTIDISLNKIEPDPAAEATRDPSFINLVCMKAAAIVLNSEVRYYAVNSLRVQDGPSSIDSTTRAGFIKDAARILNEQFEKAKLISRSSVGGVAVMTPYTVSSLYPVTRFT